MEVDFEKLLTQDEDFAKFVHDAAFEIVMNDVKQRQAILSTIYSFYNVGMTMEQFKGWLTFNQMFGNYNG